MWRQQAQSASSTCPVPSGSLCVTDRPYRATGYQILICIRNAGPVPRWSRDRRRRLSFIQIYAVGARSTSTRPLHQKSMTRSTIVERRAICPPTRLDFYLRHCPFRQIHGRVTRSGQRRRWFIWHEADARSQQQGTGEKRLGHSGQHHRAPVSVGCVQQWRRPAPRPARRCGPEPAVGPPERARHEHLPLHRASATHRGRRRRAWRIGPAAPTAARAAGRAGP